MSRTSPTFSFTTTINTITVIVVVTIATTVVIVTSLQTDRSLGFVDDGSPRPTPPTHPRPTGHQPRRPSPFHRLPPARPTTEVTRRAHQPFHPASHSSYIQRNRNGGRERAHRLSRPTPRDCRRGRGQPSEWQPSHRRRKKVTRSTEDPLKIDGLTQTVPFMLYIFEHPE